MTDSATQASKGSPRTSESLAAALTRAGGPVELLRNLDTMAHPFLMVPEFSNWRSEQRAWATSCVLLDQTDSMNDLFLSGPDAERLLKRVSLNSYATFGPARAKQLVAVNSDGYLIGDGVLFHLEEGHYDLTGLPMVLDWVQFHAESGEYDVTVDRDDNSAVRKSDPPRLYRYELQGPTATAIMEQAIGAAVPPTKFFHMARVTIAGHAVWALRHGMAGQTGFEIFGPWDEGAAVLESLLVSGADHGLVRGGRRAYSTANLGSGWVPAPLPAIFGDDVLLQNYREWLPLASIGSLGGSMDSTDISAYYLDPYDLGYGSLVNFDHDFIGRDALQRLAEQQQRVKVTLVWNSDDVAAVFGSMLSPGLGAKYIELPKARYALHQEDKVLVDGQQIGISLDCGYLTNEQAMVSLATIDNAHAAPGTEVTVLWGEQPVSRKPVVEQHEQVEIRATVAPVPFAAYARDRYRSQ